MVDAPDLSAPNSITYPVLKPLLPTADSIVPYLRRIDDKRWYTNHGPLLVEFEAGLARHFAVAPGRIATSTNATMAISQTLRALRRDEGAGLCVMPAWTFVATPAAAVWAGFEPFFVDVDPASWLIEPDRVREIARERPVGAVIVTSAFGAPLDLEPWDRFTEETGIPVLVDAAAGFDGFARCGEWNGTTPVIVSLHATKVSGIGEGAVVIGDEALARRVRQFGNFGFRGSRDAAVAGTNGKMSEYSAGIGLALLDEWAARRDGWAALSDWFAEGLASLPQLGAAPGFNEGWISSYGLIELPAGHSAEAVASGLAASGIETRQWWGQGCHRASAYEACARDELPETDRLGRQVLGLPFWLGMTQDDIATVFSTLRRVLRDRGAAS